MTMSSSSDQPYETGLSEARSSSACSLKLWKDDWDAARQALIGWWTGRGLALSVGAPKDEPWEAIPKPEPAESLDQQWLDPEYRVRWELWRMSRTYFGGTSLPIFGADIGPGSLGLFLGATGHLAHDTVWYDPCITDPDSSRPLQFRRDHCWVKRHAALLHAARQHADGRYLIGSPDLIENIDTLAQLRGPETLLMDLVERPEWVLQSIDEINQAWSAAYDWLLRDHHLMDRWGGTTFSAFSLWGPGYTAKVQCDLSCMISPAMFKRFVMPALDEQCSWLNNAMYHLDGTQALPQLDNLLSINSLNAIEWTPQAGLPGGGSPRWYDVYKRIRAAGKSVQAVGVAYDEVEPLVDAVGAEGLMIMTSAKTEKDARALLRKVGWPSA